MSTNKVVLTYKRKRYGAHSGCGESVASHSKLVKSVGPTDVIEEKASDVGCSGVDPLSHKKQDFTPEVYSNANVPDHSSDDLKKKSGFQLPDLNLAGCPAPFDMDVPPEDVPPETSRFPEEVISTQFVSEGSTLQVPHPEVRSLTVPDVSGAPLITFTRRAKMKKDMTKTQIKDGSLGRKNIEHKLDKDDSDSKEGAEELIYRGETSHSVNEKDMAHVGNAHNDTQCQERVPLPTFSDTRGKAIHCLPEKSATFTNFQGPSACHADASSSSVTCLGSKSKALEEKKSEASDNMRRPLEEKNHEASDYASRFLLGSSPSTAKMQTIDNVLFGAKMLNQRQQGLSLSIRRHPSTWSDEELDCLWMGVRRHGRNNWTAILRDPRLYFQNGRTAKDLADKWDFEQSRLFGNVQFPSLDNNKPGDNLVTNFPLECPVLRAENRLSLNNVYFQKSGNHANRSTFQIPGTGASGLTPGLSSSPYVINDFVSNPIRKKPVTSSQKQIPLQRPSVLERNATGKPSILPHWLKDAIREPPQRLNEIPMPLESDSCGFVLKRSIACGGMNSTRSHGNESLAGRKSSRFDLNRCSSEQVEVSDDNLVVLVRTDAPSSEETISDDGRM